MRRRWIRHRPGPEENRKAGMAALATLGLGAVASTVVFYLARILFARRRIDRPGEVRPLDARGEEEPTVGPGAQGSGGTAGPRPGESGGGEEAVGAGRERR